MNVASLELCRELYQLSGWDGTHFLYTKTGRLSTIASMFSYKPLPAYDLGYLLRKLAYTKGSKELGVSIRYVNERLGVDLKGWVGKWIAYHPWLRQEEYPYADTPEDAAVELAIHLFKQGILKPEEAK